MNKIFFGIGVMLITGLMACNNNDKKNDGDETPAIDLFEPKTLADSLLKHIIKVHDFGMSQLTPLHITKKKVRALIDSINNLPAGEQQKVAKYLYSLNAVSKDLDNADVTMDKWMTEFRDDSAINNPELRIRYLTDEKLKIDTMKVLISTSLQKGDSLLKAKF